MAGATFDAFANTAASDGIEVASSVSADTKGSYVELDASLSAAADGLLLEIRNANPVPLLVDIATGGAGAETDILSNIFVPNGRRVNDGDMHIQLPFDLASGTRISARCQSSAGNDSAFIAGRAYTGGALEGGSFTATETMGVSAVSSAGTTIDPGATANTKGSWTEITSSTTNALKGLILSVGNNRNIDVASAQWLVDIGTGAAAAETVIVGNLRFTTDMFSDILIPECTVLIPVDISASTRIAIRAQCSINDATDRIIEVGLVGVVGTADAGGSASGARNPLAGPIG